jgi:hypothetical protein
LHKLLVIRSGLLLLLPSEEVAKELLPVLKEHPSLRQGSYSATMEEVSAAILLALLPLFQASLLHPAQLSGWCSSYYLQFVCELTQYAEARAFLVFLSEGRLIKAEELGLVEPEEYLGGVLDMTGGVGPRVAPQAAGASLDIRCWDSVREQALAL